MYWYVSFPTKPKEGKGMQCKVVKQGGSNIVGAKNTTRLLLALLQPGLHVLERRLGLRERVPLALQPRLLLLQVQALLLPACALEVEGGEARRHLLPLLDHLGLHALLDLEQLGVLLRGLLQTALDLTEARRFRVDEHIWGVHGQASIPYVKVQDCAGERHR